MLIVTAARTDLKLVSLDALKAELGITDTTDDDFLSDVLDRVSEQVESYCARVFAVETVSETLRPTEALDQLLLARRPITAIETLTEDGEALTADDYEIDAVAGILTRLRDDRPCRWRACKIVVAYTAGSATIPGPVRSAVIELAKLRRGSRTRDPLLRSENILEGLYSYQVFAPSDVAGGMPAEVEGMLGPYRNFVVG